MLPTPHPEVLAYDWLPPVVLGREVEVAELVRQLDAPRPRAPAPWMAAAVGPRGCGTSAVARRAAREVADRVRASGAVRPPRWIAVRTAQYRGTHGVATALLHAMDDGFDGRGFPVVEILAGFLRRLRREGRSCVLVLDDVVAGGPDLGPILRALGDPDRFLPEGEVGIPPAWTVLAGTPEAVRRAETEIEGRWRIGPFVPLSPYSVRGLRVLLEDRATRALGRPPPVDLMDRLVESTVADGGGATRAIDLLRRALVGGAHRRLGTSPGPRGGEVAIESWVVRAIEEASHGVSAVLGEVRRVEARYARERGVAPLPPTTLWRRIVRLEQAGYLRREVRPGGLGGTRSLLRLVAPVDEWVITPHHRETRRGSAPWSGSRGSDEPVPGGVFRPPLEPDPRNGAPE